jgi:hypothetical protein
MDLSLLFLHSQHRQRAKMKERMGETVQPLATSRKSQDEARTRLIGKWTTKRLAKQRNNPAALKMAPTCLPTLLCKNVVAIWLQDKSEIGEESASLSLSLSLTRSLLTVLVKKDEPRSLLLISASRRKRKLTRAVLQD